MLDTGKKTLPCSLTSIQHLTSSPAVRRERDRPSDVYDHYTAVGGCREAGWLYSGAPGHESWPDSRASVRV